MTMAFRAILSNFFEEHWTQNHPQYLSVLSRALFPTMFPEIAVWKVSEYPVNIVLNSSLI